MKKFMMIGLVVFGGTQGIHGIGLIGKHVRPTRHLGDITPTFLSKLFNIQSRKATPKLWESDLAAKVAASNARKALIGLGDKKYDQIFSAGKRPSRSWMPNPTARRMKLVDTNNQIHADVFNLYKA